MFPLVKSEPAGISLPTNTRPSSRLVTIRSKSFTSLTPTAGLPGGSVQTSVNRNGKRRDAVEFRLTFQVWLSPVASALVGSWSQNIRPPLFVIELPCVPSVSGRLLVIFGNPHPCKLIEFRTCKSYWLLTERAPLINNAFISAGLFVRPARSKNSCINASSPETTGADMLVPLS